MDGMDYELIYFYITGKYITFGFGLLENFEWITKLINLAKKGDHQLKP